MQMINYLLNNSYYIYLFQILTAGNFKHETHFVNAIVVALFYFLGQINKYSLVTNYLIS